MISKVRSQLFLFVLTLFLAGQVLSNSIPEDLREKICTLNEVEMEARFENIRYSYSLGIKNPKKFTDVGKSYWLCIDDGRIFLNHHFLGQQMILDEFVWQNGYMFVIRVDGPSFPTRKFTWSSDNNKLILKNVRMPVGKKSVNRHVRAKGHIVFKDNEIEIEFEAPLSPDPKRFDDKGTMSY